MPWPHAKTVMVWFLTHIIFNDQTGYIFKVCNMRGPSWYKCSVIKPKGCQVCSVEVESYGIGPGMDILMLSLKAVTHLSVPLCTKGVVHLGKC